MSTDSGRVKRSPHERGRPRQRLTVIVLALVAVAIGAAVAVARMTARRQFGAQVIQLVIHSRFVGAAVRMNVVVPEGPSRKRPLLVFLHGRGGSEASELTAPFFAALHALGDAAPVVAFPSGGDHSYWHDRRDGAWGSYVLHEVIPTAATAGGADGRRIAIGGISMGGFGAYDLARRSPGRFCAVGGHSAAMWRTAAATAPGAFDDAADFARNDVLRSARTDPTAFRSARLWLDGGTRDPFRDTDQALAVALHIPMRVWPGGHTNEYWNAHWRDYLGFYSRALAGCHPGVSTADAAPV